MRESVATLLTRREDGHERPTLQNSPSSEIEREVLELLQLPAGYPPSWKELRIKLLPFFTELEIQNGIISLLEKGDIQLVYDEGCELTLRVA